MTKEYKIIIWALVITIPLILLWRVLQPELHKKWDRQAEDFKNGEDLKRR